MNRLKPKTLIDLEKLISEEIDKNGSQCSLNHIDVSLIEDTSMLFMDSSFNGDISKWDMSRVRFMNNMFRDSLFNRDISQWDLSAVKTMCRTFQYSRFNSNISQWGKSCDVDDMFNGSDFTGDLRPMKLGKVKLSKMFGDTLPGYLEVRKAIEENEALKTKYSTNEARSSRKTL